MGIKDGTADAIEKDKLGKKVKELVEKKQKKLGGSQGGKLLNMFR